MFALGSKEIDIIYCNKKIDDNVILRNCNYMLELLEYWIRFLDAHVYKEHNVSAEIFTYRKL